MSEFGRFFLPGPTEVLPEILAAQTRPMIGHRGAGCSTLIAGMQPVLRDVFGLAVEPSWRPLIERAAATPS